MITIFNRKELFITFDMKEYARIRDILEANKIDYYLKITNPAVNGSISGGGRRPVVIPSSTRPIPYEHKIYVHKKDYEYASKLIYQKNGVSL